MSFRNLQLALLVSTILLGSVIAQEARNSRVQPDREVIMKGEAESLVLARNRLGANLTSILRDSEQPVAERHEAARLLAKLQYMAVIDDLIRHIDLVDPS